MAVPDGVVALTSRDAISAACTGALLAPWAAQGLGRGVRAWGNGGAVAVASSRLSNRDRLVVQGSPRAATDLVRAVLPLVGDTYRPLGPPGVIAALAAALPEITPVGEFAWMQTRAPLPPGPPGPPGPPTVVTAEWLAPGAHPEVTSLLSIAFPDSTARPGVPGVQRWAGVRIDGELLAVAAEAWSAPDVGFVSGVASHPAARGRGYGTAVCRLVFEELLRTHGALALFVAGRNEPAVRLYRSFGMNLHPVAVARIERVPGAPT